MITTTTPATFTPEDLLKMPDGDRYELVDGNLVERNVSLWSSYVAGELHGLLSNYCEGLGLGWVLPGGVSYQCFPDDPRRVRRPNVSFIKKDRLSLAQAEEEGHVPLVPDLAVEVISPNDLYYEVDVKVNEWLQAGVRLLWVVNPRTHQVRIYRANGSEALVRAEDQFSGEEVVPGFQCRVNDLFQPPPGSAPT